MCDAAEVKEWCGICIPAQLVPACSRSQLLKDFRLDLPYDNAGETLTQDTYLSLFVCLRGHLLLDPAPGHRKFLQACVQGICNSGLSMDEVFLVDSL